MRVLSPFTVNPLASGPPLVPSVYGSVHENDDRPALRTAILVDVLSFDDSLGSHVYGVYGAASQEFGDLECQIQQSPPAFESRLFLVRDPLVVDCEMCLRTSGLPKLSSIMENSPTANSHAI
jgi:hypothetical protein